MGLMFVVTLREGIEAFLIVAIAAMYRRKTGREALLSAVWWGRGAAALLSLALGGWITYAMVLVPAAWLAFAHLRGQKVVQAA